MSDDALAVSVGEGMQDGLTDLLTTPPAEPLATFSVELDATRYYEFIAAGVAADPDRDLEDVPEINEAVQELMAAPAELFDRFKVDMVFTENGAEFVSSATLKD